MQMVERVLMKKMRFIDEENRKESFLRELRDMGADGVENVAGGIAMGNGKGQAKLTIEVASAKGNVVAIGETKILAGDGMSEGA